MATPIQKTATSWEYIILRDSSNKIVIMQGTTVPTDATTWYAKWCIFIDTDVTSWNTGVYENIWTSTSCLFVKKWNSVDLSDATVAAQTATATLDNTIAWKMLTNTWASGWIVLTLPAASTLAWKYFWVTVLAAQTVALSPVATDWIFLNGSWVDNKDLALAWTIWTSAIIYSDWTNYKVVSHTSWVTKEA